MKHLHPWQYETAKAMTEWNTDTHDSMKRWKQWQYESLTAMTVWNPGTHMTV